MPSDDNEIKAIRIILGDIRRKLDREIRNTSADQVEIDNLLGVSLQVEGIRSRLSFLPMNIREARAPLSSRIMLDVKQGLDLVLNNQNFMAYAKLFKSIDVGFTTGRRELLPYVKDIVYATETLDELLHYLRRIIENYELQTSFFDDNGEIRDIKELTSVVPSQKVGPVQLTIRNDKLAIAKQISTSANVDADNVSRARSEIFERGQNLLKELKSSNNDPRLIAEVERINATVSNSDNIIEIGISNIGCGMLATSLRDEMAPALSAMLNTYTMSIDMYVAQFPDWNRFIEQAALAQIDNDDVIRIRATAEKVIDRLMERSDIVEPEVPETFKALIGLLNDPRKTTKRAAFAVLRTLENLISKSVAYAGELVTVTAKKTVDKLSSTLSSALVVGLLTIAVNTSTGIAPIANKIQELQWLKNAIEVIQAHIEKFKTGES